MPVEITQEMREAVHREDALRECAGYGHDHELIKNGLGELIAVFCNRCGRRYRVVPE